MRTKRNSESKKIRANDVQSQQSSRSIYIQVNLYSDQSIFGSSYIRGQSQFGSSYIRGHSKFGSNKIL